MRTESAVAKLHARTLAQDRIRNGLRTMGAGLAVGMMTIFVGGVDLLASGTALVLTALGCGWIVAGRRHLRTLAVSADGRPARRLPTAKLRR